MDAEIDNRKMEAPEYDFFGFRVDFSGFWGPPGEPKSLENRKNAEKIDPEKNSKKKVPGDSSFSPGL